ncbi:hypothetical protein N665_0396s0009 [Sinapis alba]|nr:hypothetical protein N665_0396s0009 [Sinapis alba]
MVVQRQTAASNSSNPCNTGQHTFSTGFPSPIWIKPPKTSTHAPSFNALIGHVDDGGGVVIGGRSPGGGLMIGGRSPGGVVIGGRRPGGVVTGGGLMIGGRRPGGVVIGGGLTIGGG